MHQLLEANHLLDDGQAVRATIEEQGYAFFRDVLPLDAVHHARRAMAAWLVSQGVATIDDGLPRWTGTDPHPLGEYPPALYATGVFEWLLLHPGVRAVLDRALGERVRVLPMGEYQFSWPGKPDCWSRVHQDGAYIPGLEFYVAWIPLMPIDAELGGLALVPTPQSQQSLHPPADPESTSTLLPLIPMGTFPDDAWHRADYRPGDLLVFGAWTPHLGLPNTSERLRLSIDTRVQPESFTPPILGVVVGEDDGTITIQCDDHSERVLRLDADTSAPLYGTTGLLGRRILATADGDRAVLVRNQRGFIPA